MTFLHDFISEQSIFSLGWTIVHSLWQILVIAAILKVLLNIFKNASTNMRYMLSASALVMILAAGIITFISIYTNYQPEIAAAATNDPTIFNSLLSQTELTEKFTILAIPALVAEQYKIVMAWLGMNLSLIVMLWMMGIVLFMLKFAGNLFYVQRLKRYGTKSVSNEWHAMLKSLSDKIGVKKHVQLLESVFAKAPMVIGHIKPVILLPTGLLFSMPVDQIEAIFAHELAHIRRKDYLFNTLKAILEVIFFYHPALWWIVFIFEEEREHCCDDITLSNSVDALALSKALVTAAAFQMRAPTMAPAFYRKHHSLFKRIRRMNTKKHQAQKFNGKPMALAVILTGLIAFVLSSSFTGSNGLVNLDSMIPNQTLMVDDANNSNHLPNTSPALQPDGNEMIPQEKPNDKELAELKSNLKNLYSKTEQMQDKLTAYKKELSMREEGITQEQKDNIKKMYYILQETEKNLDELKIKLKEKNEALATADFEKADQIMLNQKESLVKVYAMMEQLELQGQGLSKAEQKEMYEEQMKLKKEQEEMLKKERWAKFQAVMKYEMIEDGIIKKGDYATVELSQDVLKVNDKKQSKDAHEKYLKLMYKVTGEKPNPDAPYAFIIN